jgi:benzodiazapine receptor
MISPQQQQQQQQQQQPYYRYDGAINVNRDPMHNESKWRRIGVRAMPIVNIIAFSFMILINVLSSLRVINGKDNAEVSNKYFTRFTPAGWTFSIWGLIYGYISIFLTAHVVQGLIRGRDNELMNRRIGFLFAYSCVCNGIWLVLWSFELLWASAAVMTIGLLLPLVLIYSRVGIRYGKSGQTRLITKEFTWNDSVEYPMDKRPLQRWEYWIIYPTVSLYLGWICVATIANWMACIVSLNKNSEVRSYDFSYGITQQGWSSLFQALSTVLTLGFFMLLRKDFVQPLVQILALLGIFSQQKKIHDSKRVVITSWLSITVLAFAWIGLVIYLLNDYRRRRTERKKFEEERGTRMYFTSEA